MRIIVEKLLGNSLLFQSLLWVPRYGLEAYFYEIFAFIQKFNFYERSSQMITKNKNL